MDFRFDEEQLMIRDTASAFLADASSSAALRAMIGDDEARKNLWQRIVTEMGWQALTVPEDCDGLGLGMVELAIVFEEAGARLLASPLFATLGAGVSVLRACATDTQLRDWLPAVAAGEETLALGLQAPGMCWGSAGLGLRYEQTSSGYLLNGEVQYCNDGESADSLLLIARDAGSDSPDLARVFRVPAEALEERRFRRSTLDQTRSLATIAVDKLAVPNEALLSQSSQGWSQIGAGLDLATIALAAEQLGVAQQCLDMTVAYTLEREQFGRPIAGFQAIKHKAADMMLRVECARSALYYAACTADGWLEGAMTAAALAEASSIAKVACGDAAFANAAEALQMHGGNGFTWEYDIQLFFKRARASRAQFGNSEWHRDRIAAQLLDVESHQGVAP